MIKGLWSGITNCEACIYDRNCGHCIRRQPQSLLDDQSSLTSPPESVDSGHCNKMLEDFLSEYDIVSAPDPTSSVSIVQVPEITLTIMISANTV